MNRRKGPIAIVAQHGRLTAPRAQHDVQIAVGLDVNRPCTRVRRISDCLRQLHRRGHIGKAVRLLLSKETNSSFPREQQIRLEVIVEVEREHALRRGPLPRRSTRKRQICAV